MKNINDEYRHWMEICFELGNQAKILGESPVGCVITNNNQLLGQGYEQSRSRNDITCHAEVVAIRNAITISGIHALRGATLFTTHEPCPLCSYVIRYYALGKVVYVFPTNSNLSGWPSAVIGWCEFADRFYI